MRRIVPAVKTFQKMIRLARQQLFCSSVAAVVAISAMTTTASAQDDDDDDNGGCEAGDDDGGPPVDRGPPVLPDGKSLRYKDVERIIEQRCVRCHRDGGRAEFLIFATFADVAPMREFMLDALGSGFMPLNKPNWRYKKKALILQAWLKEGVEWNN